MSGAYWNWIVGGCVFFGRGYPLLGRSCLEGPLGFLCWEVFFGLSNPSSPPGGISKSGRDTFGRVGGDRGG